MEPEGDRLHVVTADNISDARRTFGSGLIWGSAGIMALVAVLQVLQTTGSHDFGFETWRPTLYAYVLWSVCLCAGAGDHAGRAGQAGAFRAAGGALRRCRWWSFR